MYRKVLIGKEKNTIFVAFSKLYELIKTMIFDISVYIKLSPNV